MTKYWLDADQRLLRDWRRFEARVFNERKKTQLAIQVELERLVQALQEPPT